MRLFLIDAFADTPFTGNPAAVCMLDRDVSEDWMQSLAMEMNQAETAFVRPIDGGFSLRWFTPTAEVDLCGHATLASAHALWRAGDLKSDQEARFLTKSGWLLAKVDGDKIEMDFPSEPPVESDDRIGFQSVLGCLIGWTGRNRMDMLAVLDSEASVRGLKPDFPQIAALGSRALIVTAQSDPGRDYDFVSRVFAPRFGIPEDPVTGSAHCCLCPFWCGRLGKSSVVGFQASNRGGYVGVAVQADRVKLFGRAITVFAGEIADFVIPSPAPAGPGKQR